MADINVCPRCLKLEKTIQALKNKLTKKNQLIKLHKELSECIELKKLKYSSDEVGAIYKSAIKDAQVLRDRLNFYINENSELSKLTDDLRCRISQLENKCKDGENKLNHIVFINKQLLDNHTSSEKEIIRLKKKIKKLTKYPSRHIPKYSEAKESLGLAKLKSHTEETSLENKKSIGASITDKESILDQDKSTSFENKSNEDSFSDCSFTDAESIVDQDKDKSEDHKPTEEVSSDSSFIDTEPNVDQDKDISEDHKSNEDTSSDSSFIDPRTNQTTHKSHSEDKVKINSSVSYTCSDTDFSSTVLDGSKLYDEVPLEKSILLEGSTFVDTEKNPEEILKTKENQETSSAQLQLSENEKITFSESSDSKCINLIVKPPCSVGQDLSIYNKEDFLGSKATCYKDSTSIFDFSSDNSDLLNKDLLNDVLCKESSSFHVIPKNNSADHMPTRSVSPFQASVDSHNSPKNHSFNTEILNYPKESSPECVEFEFCPVELCSDKKAKNISPKVSFESSPTTIDLDCLNDKTEPSYFNLDTDTQQSLVSNMEQEKGHHAFDSDDVDECISYKLVSRSIDDTQSSVTSKKTPQPRVHEHHEGETQESLDYNKSFNLNASLTQCPELVSPLKSVKCMTSEKSDVRDKFAQNKDIQGESSTIQKDDNIISSKKYAEISPNFDSSVFNESNTVSNQEHSITITDVNSVKNECFSSLQYNGVTTANSLNKDKFKEQNDDLFGRKLHVSPESNTFSPQYHLCNQNCIYECCNCKDTSYHDRANFVWSFKDNSSVQISVPVKKGSEKIGIQINDVTDNTNISAETNGVKPATSKYSIVVNLKPEKVTSDFNCDCPSSRIGNRKIVKLNDCRSCEPTMLEKEDLTDNAETIDKNVKWHKWRKIQEITEYPVKGNLSFAKNSYSKKNSWSFLSPMVFPRIFTHVDTDVLREAFESLSLDHSTHFTHFEQDNSATFSLDNKPMFYNPLSKKSSERANRVFGKPSSEVVGSHQSNFCLKASMLHQQNRNYSRHGDISPKPRRQLSYCSEEVNTKSLEAIVSSKEIISGDDRREHYKTTLLNPECSNMNKSLPQQLSKRNELEVLPRGTGIFQVGLSSANAEVLIKSFPSEKHISSVQPIIRSQTFLVDSSNKCSYNGTNTFKNSSFDFQKSTTPTQVISKDHPTEEKKNPVIINPSTIFPNASNITKSQSETTLIQTSTNISDNLDLFPAKESSKLLVPGSKSSPIRKMRSESSEPLVIEKELVKADKKFVIHDKKLPEKENVLLNKASVQSEKCVKSVGDGKVNNNGVTKQLYSTDSNLKSAPLEKNIKSSDSEQSKSPSEQLLSEIPEKRFNKVSQNSQLENDCLKNLDDAHVIKDSKQAGTKHSSPFSPFKKKMAPHCNYQNTNVLENSTKVNTKSTNELNKPLSRSNREKISIKENSTRGEGQNVRSPPISDSETDNFPLKKRRIAHVIIDSKCKAVVPSFSPKKTVSRNVNTTGLKSPEKELINEEAITKGSIELVSSNKNKVDHLSINNQEKLSLKNIFKVPKDKVLKKRLPGFRTKNILINDGITLEKIFKSFHCIEPLSPLSKSPVFFNDEDCEDINNENDGKVHEMNFTLSQSQEASNNDCDLLPCSNGTDNQHIIEEAKSENKEDNLLDFEAGNNVKMTENIYERASKDKACYDYSDLVMEPDEDDNAGENVNLLKCKAVNDSKQDLSDSKSDVTDYPTADSSSSINNRDEESEKLETYYNKETIVKKNADLSYKSCILDEVSKNSDSTQENDEFMEEQAAQNLDSSKQPNDIGKIKMERKIEEDIKVKSTKYDKPRIHNNAISQNCDTAFNVFVENYQSRSQKVNTQKKSSVSKKRDFLDKTKDSKSKEVCILPNNNVNSKFPLIKQINKKITSFSSLKKDKEESTENQFCTRDDLHISNQLPEEKKEPNQNLTPSQKPSEVSKSDELSFNPLEIVSDESNTVYEEEIESRISFKGMKKGVETQYEKKAHFTRMNRENIFAKKNFSNDKEEFDVMNVDSNPIFEHNKITSNKSQCNSLIESIYSRDNKNCISSYKRETPENEIHNNTTSSNKMFNTTLNNSNPEYISLLTLKNNPNDIPVCNDSTLTLISNIPINPHSEKMDESFGFKGFYIDTSETWSSDLPYEGSEFKKEDALQQGNETQKDCIDLSPMKKETGASYISIEEKGRGTGEINYKKRNNDDFSENLESPSKKIKLSEEILGNCALESLDLVECKENLFICAIKYFTSEVLNSGWEKDLKPNINKKDISDIKYQIMRLAGASEDNLYQHVNKVVQPLIDSPIMQPRPFAKAIIEILCEDNGKELDQYPKMTKTTKLCLLFTISYIGYNRAFLLETLKVFEESLCAYYDKTLSVPNGIKLVTYYAALCRSYNLDSKGKQLLYDILYARHIKAYPMIYKCLQIWPTILPKAEKSLAEGCLLTQTIAFILIAAKKTAVAEKLQNIYRTNNLRMYLKNCFGYDSDFKRRDDLCDELVKKISENGSRLALVLLAQCEGYEWAVTLVEKKLFPLVLAWLQDKLDNSTVQHVILAIGMIVRAFPLSKSAYFVKNTLDLLEKVLHRSPDDKFAEIVIEAVSLIRRHNLMLCVLILIKWIPLSKTVTKKTLVHVRNILSVKNITHWRSFYIKHHTYEETDSLPL